MQRFLCYLNIFQKIFEGTPPLNRGEKNFLLRLKINMCILNHVCVQRKKEKENKSVAVICCMTENSIYVLYIMCVTLLFVHILKIYHMKYNI